MLIVLIFGREAMYAWFETHWPACRYLLVELPFLGGLLALVRRLLHLLHRQHEAGIGILYAASYVGVCWAILGVLVPGRAGWHWGLWLYGGLGLVNLLLLLVSQLTQWPVLAQFTNPLVDFLLSPLPVIVLIPLWHAVQPPRPIATMQRA
ncbi:MAG: hypothetical protein EOO62_14030 [Hymenobacter sp.]|nr:MAG: hypothetical protein EOO62_14030 [Hymenobacter sp.]